MSMLSKVFCITLIMAGLAMSSMAQAVSFSADAIQLRDGQFSHARLFWSEGRVRFEYVEDGVPMVQIYDTVNNKVIWLDTEAQLFMVQAVSDEQQFDPMIKKKSTLTHPCDSRESAVCTRLKDVVINDRNTVKWLVTETFNDFDEHTFLWIDKAHGLVVRQELPDDSFMTVVIDDDQEFDGRKVRKLTISEFAMDFRNITTQWYDEALNIIIRQQYENGSMDELRNIKIEDVSAEKFSIPESYRDFNEKPQNKNKESVD